MVLIDFELVKFPLNGPHVAAAIGYLGRPAQHPVAFPQSRRKGFSNVSRSLAGSDALDKLSRKGRGQTEGHFSCRHNAIIP